MTATQTQKTGAAIHSAGRGIRGRLAAGIADSKRRKLPRQIH
jgi:hypothetical protein